MEASSLSKVYYLRKRRDNKRVSSFFLCLFVFVFHVSVDAATFYVDQQTFGETQALPFSYLRDKWQAPVREGHRSAAYSWSEIGVRQKDFSFGIVNRYDFIALYSPDTIYLLHQTKNQQALISGQSYTVDFNVSHYRAVGGRVEYRDNNQFSDTEIRYGFTLLGAYFLTEGRLTGNAVVVGEKDYTFDFNVDYYYAEDEIFNRPVGTVTGWGLSSDIFLKTKRWLPLTLHIAAHDLFGLIYWPNAPRTVAQANSGTKQYDENGYVRFQPLMTGRESNETYWQWLQPRIFVDFDYDFESTFFGSRTSIFTYAVYETFYAGIKNTNLRYSFGYQLITNTIEFAISYSKWNLSLQADHWRLSRMHTIGINLGAEFAW